ncbi:hypothetical protein [Humidesulfovibrio idahonensis]
MDKSTEEILTRFLHASDKRELDYFHRGKLVASSSGDGRAQVDVSKSSLMDRAFPSTRECSSPQELFAALRWGMSELCDADDVDDTLETFVGYLNQPRQD